MKFKNYKKITFLAAILGILLFAFIFFYNKEEATSAIQQWDWECQEEMEIMGTYVGGGEIPIGEAMDGTLAMAKEIIRNYDLMLPAGGQVVVAANKIYDLPLPDDCTADNCDTGCWMTYDETCWGECEDVTVDDKDCSLDPDECPFQNCTGSCADIVDNVCMPGVPCPPAPQAVPGSCDCVTTPGTCCWDQITTCNCGPPGSCDISSPLCHEVMAGEVWCWGHEKCNEAQACSASCDPIVCPVGSTGPDCCWFLGPTGEYCWETTATGQYCDCGDVCPPGEPFCFDVGTETKCWGDDECFDKSLGGACEEVCIRNFDCDIIECNGNACPIDAIVELGDQRAIITTRALQIATYAAAINTEVQKSPGLMALLEKARIGLKMCATPASGYEPAEEVQLLETLVSCQEAKWLRMLSEDQDNCYNNNFFCCLPIEK